MPRFSQIEVEEILARSKTLTGMYLTDSVAPAAPSVSVTAEFSSAVVVISMASPPDDLAGYSVYRHTADISGASTKVGAVLAGSDGTATFIDTTADIGTAYYYWAKAIDHSGNISGFSATAGPVTPIQVQSGQIASGAINVAAIFAPGVVDAAAIANNAVTPIKTCLAAIDTTSGCLTANSVVSCNIVAGAICTYHIIAGAVTACTIAAGAITASKLAVAAPGAALNQDPSILDPGSWGIHSGTTLLFCSVTDGKVGNYTLRSSTSAVWACECKAIPLDPNKSYRIRAWARKSSADGRFYLAIALQDSTGANITGDGSWWSYDAASSVVPGDVWTEYYAVVGYGTANTFPSNARTMKPGVILNYGGTTGYMEVQDVRIEEATPSTLIQDGAITTDKLTANAVTAAKICAGAISTCHISTVGLCANCIKAGCILSTNWGTSAGSCFNLDSGTFYLGGSSAPKLSWNGSTLTVNGVVCATSGCFSGTITSTAGSIGGWTICSGWLGSTVGSNSLYFRSDRPVIYTYGTNGTVGSYAMMGKLYKCGSYQNAYGFSATQTEPGDLAFGAGLVTGASFYLPDCPSTCCLTSGCPFFWVGTSTSYMKWYNGLLTLNGAFRITRTASDISSAWITLCNTCSNSGQYCLIYVYSCASLPIYAYTTQNTAIRASAVGNIGLYATTDANIAVNACAAVSYGVCARAMCCFGVFGYACSCYGVCGQAYFAYPVGGNGAYYNASTRALKTSFESVEVLTALRCLCIQKWTWNDANMRGFDEFIGPVAEDVQAAFRLTFNNDGVYQLDGIALKAAQELDLCITAQNACISSLESRLANIEARLSQCA